MHEDDEVEIVLPSPQYTLLECTRDALPEIIVVNEALRDFPHGAIFPWFASVIIECTDLADNGMPTPDERDLMDAIGDEIEAVVLDGRTAHGADNALFLARSTWNARRELIYLVHDPEIAHAALQALIDSRDWERPWDYRMEHDPEWALAGEVFALLPARQRLDS